MNLLDRIRRWLCREPKHGWKPLWSGVIEDVVLLAVGPMDSLGDGTTPIVPMTVYAESRSAQAVELRVDQTRYTVQPGGVQVKNYQYVIAEMNGAWAEFRVSASGPVYVELESF